MSKTIIVKAEVELVITKSTLPDSKEDIEPSLVHELVKVKSGAFENLVSGHITKVISIQDK